MVDKDDLVADADDSEMDLASLVPLLRSMLELARDIRRELVEVLELMDRVKTTRKTWRPK